MSRKGFTLIELLVVVAIIAILAAILMPVFARARDNAHKATCQANLKNISVAVIMYCTDHDGRGPSRTENPVLSWAKQLNAYRCGVYTELGQLSPVWQCRAGSCVSYYSMPYNRAGYYMANSGVYWTLDQSTAPIDDILVGGSGIAMEPAHPMMYGTKASMCKPKGYWSAYVYHPEAAAHHGGNNLAFFDGHVKWVNEGTMDIHWATMSNWRD